MNSARRLQVMLDKWSAPTGSSSAERRANGDVRSMTFWSEHRIATDLLEDIELALNALGNDGTDVAVYREAVPSWYAAVFSVYVPWNSSNSGELIAPDKVAMLSALASLLDVVKWEPGGEYDTANIHETLTHAEQLIREDPILGDETRRYLLGLLEEFRFCLQNIDENGNAPARRISMELVGALTTVATTSANTADQKKWMGLAWKLSGLVGTTVVTKAVEGGMEWIGHMLEK